MKSFVPSFSNISYLVAPFAGAWIEILLFLTYRNFYLSLPSRERGLKYVILNDIFTTCDVAPFAGAWIEIRVMYNTHCLPIVAPFAGAWIERLKFI